MLSDFTNACFEAAVFADCGPDDETHEKEWSNQAKTVLATHCQIFYRMAQPFLQNCEGMNDSRAGHDFWLTRNGHGAGFWDGDWPEPYASRLTELAKQFGQADLYLGDDDLVYIA